MVTTLRFVRRAMLVSMIPGMLSSSAACHDLEAPTDPTPGQLVVHAVLDASVSVQTVIVERARTGVPVGRDGFGGNEAVTGATVTISGPNALEMVGQEQKDPNVPVPPGWYRFNLAAYGTRILPGQTYLLHIRTLKGEDVTGHTTVPIASAVRRDDHLEITTFRRERDTLRLSWPRVAGAAGFQVNVYWRSALYTTFTDTSVMLPGSLRTIDNDPVFLRGTTTLVIASAVDTAYYEYYRVQSDPFAGIAPGRLNGAVGVFGSAVPFLVVGLDIQ